MTATISVMDQIKSDLVTAAEPGVDRTKIQTDITALQGQLQSIANSASFNGENWLSVNSGVAGYNASKSVVASFSRDTTGAISIGTITVDTSQTKLYDANNQSGILDTVNGATNMSVATLNISALTRTRTADEADALSCPDDAGAIPPSGRSPAPPRRSARRRPASTCNRPSSRACRTRSPAASARSSMRT